jgi:penicillin-binding protein 1C
MAIWSLILRLFSKEFIQRMARRFTKMFSPLNLKRGAFFIIGCSFFVGFLVAQKIPSFENYKAQFPFSDKVLYSQEGTVLSQIRTNYKTRNLIWSSIDKMNPDFIALLIQKEDQRFYSHWGIDLMSFAHAGYEALRGKPPRGASTMSMQLVKLIYKIKTKSLSGKLKQIIYAVVLEQFWTKQQILEAYLSTVPIRNEITGVATASLLLLQKSPRYLTQVEQNLFIKLINRPNLSWEALQLKICHQQKACEQELFAIEKRSLEAQYLEPQKEVDSMSYHLHRFLLSKVAKNKTEIQSSINFSLQKYAQASLKSQIEKLKSRRVQDAGLLVLENKTGNILAYVGSSGSQWSHAPHVDMVQSSRQLGSVVKPFLYATALENNLITLSSWIEDSPLEIIFPNGTYSPSNHDHQYHGWVHPAMALGSSLNVPAVKMIQLTSVESFWKTLKNLGFKMDQAPDYYGPSLALGVVESSLWQLTKAYRKLAVGKESGFSQATLQRLYWMMSYAPHRALSFGQDSILNVPQGFAVKTGTSKDMKDNWCVGFNKDYTVGVWVGNADSSSMENVLGTTGAAPIWRSVVDYLLAQNNSVEPLLHLEQIYQFHQEEQSSRPPKSFAANHIINPAKSTIYALDPSIPLKSQKLLFEAEGPQEGLEWRVQGKALFGRKWSPEKGWQKVELYRGSQKLDESVFLVK